MTGEDSAAAAIEVPAPRTRAVFTEAHVGGRYGERTIYAQIFDVNSRGSEVTSWPWQVVPPDGDFLLIDNAGGVGEGELVNRRHDQFWRDPEDGVLERAVGENYHVHDVWNEVWIPVIA